MRTKWTDRETVAKVCQALAHTKSNERIGEARALASSLLYRRIGDGSYGFAVPKLCERIGDSSYGHFRPYPDVIFLGSASNPNCLYLWAGRDNLSESVQFYSSQ